eukprot:CAMPEP_0204491646 /NCGR_PEP_ID=MMETSP0471-20130131/77732_1 /ASSEMBLY_ACC=CAM_ASM_000602 /TAXON_ID=2969 /ORGANISM="Oxyrrhis marina" /LENGTH=44 /DNA_ID= /DNA_START= /DNA_END= /DNA_ORIENTATION=
MAMAKCWAITNPMALGMAAMRSFGRRHIGTPQSAMCDSGSQFER